MGAGHAHDGLLVAGSSVVHRLPAQCKVVALVGFVLLVVATPREQWWAFPLYGAALAVVAAVASVPLRTVVRRAVVEVPFVVFALLLPFLAQGERVEVLGVGLSTAGLWGAWNLLAKGTLGVVAAILLAATTAPRDLLAGLDRLHLPAVLVQILTFMVRYSAVVTDDLRRMRIARESRCFEARHLGHLRVVAQGAGALFIRSYERGERVHLAMLSRGYAGTLPSTGTAAGGRAWALAAALPAVAAAVATSAWVAAA